MVFSSQEFVLAILVGAGEVQASRLLPVGLCSQKTKGRSGPSGQAEPEWKPVRAMAWAVLRAVDEGFLKGLNWLLCL